MALESGTSAFFVARELANLGLKPVVVDAYEVRRKARRLLQKRDRRDALKLCHGVSRGVYQSVVHVPGPEIKALRDLARSYEHTGSRDPTAGPEATARPTWLEPTPKRVSSRG